MNIINIIKILREVKIIINHLKKEKEINDLINCDKYGIIDLDEEDQQINNKNVESTDNATNKNILRNDKNIE